MGKRVSEMRARRKRKKHLKKLSLSKSNKSSDNQSDNSSECDSELQLPSSKRAKSNETKKLSLSKSNKSSDNQSDNQSDNSSECDSDFQLPSSKRAKSNETNELNVPHEGNETNSKHEETSDFNETIEHYLIKVKETISLESNQLFCNNEVKPSEPKKEKKEKDPAVNYVLLSDSYVRKINKFSKPNVDPIHDDNNNDDCDNDDYDEYYDGVAEDRRSCKNNNVSSSIFTNTKPTSSTSRSTTWYEETPLEKVSKIAFPARFFAGRRHWTPPNKRKKILQGQSVASKQSNSLTSIPSSDLKTVNNNEIFESVECQDCNSIEPRRSDRKRKHTEKFLSFTENNNRVESASYTKDNNRVPSNTAKVSNNNNSDFSTVKSSDGVVDADIIKLFDIASSQNQYSESPRSNRLLVSTEKYSSYVEENRLPKTSRSSYLDQQANYARNSRQKRKEQLHVEEISTNHRRRVKIKGLFTTLEGVWNKECPHCGYMHLDCATPHMLSNCCYNGKLSPWDNDADEMYSRYAYLKPLSKQITDAIMENIDNIGRLSASYNSVLGICRIGCENGNRETGARNTHEGGFEIRHGDHAFAISGRLYHCMAKQVSNTDPSCKLLH